MKGRTTPPSFPLAAARQPRPLTQRASNPTPARLSGFLILVLILLAATVDYGSSAKSARRGGATRPTSENAAAAAAPARGPAVRAASSPALASLRPAVTLQAAIGVETYNCSTSAAQDVFDVGETVCARATGVPAGLLFPWRVSWLVPEGLIVQSEDALDNPSTEYDYQLPTGDTATTDSGIVVKTLGTWRVYLTRANGSVRASAPFTVRSAARPTADLFVQKFMGDDTPAASGPVTFRIIVGNAGPNPAASVHLQDAAPEGASLSSFTQQSGPACTPADSADCTMASLDRGEQAEFTAIYTLGSTAGTSSASASVSSDTEELEEANNSFTAEFAVAAAGTGDSCALECPGNIVVAANTSQDPDGPGGADPISGAIVNFGAAEPFGNCGALTSSHTSGSFFPVGETTVSSSSATGGGSCSFTINVVSEPPPVISCPALVEKNITDGCSTPVSSAELGTPTTDNGAGTVTVSAARSDGQGLGEDFPAGTTSVVWTATDSLGRTASCTQTVKVNVNDTTPPTITAPADLTLTTGAQGGSCGLIINESQLGTPEAEDGGCSVNITRTGMPAGNFFPVGETTITWKATDAGGNTATATQKVTVSENTPPVIHAPADASYTCLSEVPAAHPSQATGAGTFDANGDPVAGPPSDNCGVPTVTITENSTGAGSAASPRVITRTFTATDTAGNSASSTQTITVIDPEPPSVVLAGPSAVTVECHTPFNDQGATASDNCAATLPVTVSGALDVNTPGTYTLTYTATDWAGNSSSVQRTVTVVDTTAPVISCPADISVLLPANTNATSMAVSFSVGATDSCDSTPSVATSHASGSIFGVGPTAVSATATDDANNSASCGFTVTVLYRFTGFFSPVANQPTVNQVNAGRSIAVKFSLSGNKGLGIFAAGFPASQQVACNSSAPLSELEGTETPGGSTLTYDAGSDQYHYNWKTEKSWAGTCRVLVVKLNDGSEHTALFKFK
jgi:uncharacterized repeat protein (TIGR01451 family)